MFIDRKNNMVRGGTISGMTSATTAGATTDAMSIMGNLSREQVEREQATGGGD